jgi:nucleoside-diphosphate-sugar epimerase
MTEAQAIPANPDNEYGWEELFSERVAMAYGRHSGIQVMIARFQDCYGPREPSRAVEKKPQQPFAAGWKKRMMVGRACLANMVEGIYNQKEDISPQLVARTMVRIEHERAGNGEPQCDGIDLSLFVSCEISKTSNRPKSS